MTKIAARSIAYETFIGFFNYRKKKTDLKDLLDLKKIRNVEK